MKKNYEDYNVREEMYEQLSHLMKNAARAISDGNGSDFYNSETHYYLMENAWEIMFPLEKEFWPEKFNEFLSDNNFPWPQGTTYSYIMSVICPPFIGSYNLYFGYAVVNGKLIRTSFFAINTIVKYQIMPQGMVIDPLCLAHNIRPDYYVGCLADKQDVDDFIISRKNPLELFVKRKNTQEQEKKIFDSYMESYNLQMTFEPGYFPPQLIKFCEKNNLYIPAQERNIK